MTEPKRLPPHITEDDVRLITQMIVPAIADEAWNAAVDMALEQVDAVAQYDEVPAGVTVRLEAMKRRT